MANANPEDTPTAGSQSASETIRPGDFVEYHSATAGRWIPAKVIKVNPRGTYSLDCKPEVPRDKIRRPVPRPADSTTAPLPRGGPQYAIGDRVEYFSATTKTWITAKVTARTSTGTYDLDCKPDVHPDKIRKTGFGPRFGSSDGGRHRASSSDAPRLPLASPDASPTDLNLDGPIQLVRVARSGDGWRFEVCEEATSLLERLGEQRLAIVSVSGPVASGKKYLLNLLLGRPQPNKPLCQVGDAGQGLWMWGAAPEDVSSRSQRNDQGPIVLFIGVEGFGSERSDHVRDAQFFALGALLSSVMILNTRGVVTEDILRGVAVTSRLLEHVEEGTPEASRPFLLWLLRDLSPEMLCPEGSEPMLPDDYLEHVVCGGTRSGAEPGQSLNSDEVRRGIFRFCGRRSCLALPSPLEAGTRDLSKTPLNSLQEDFRLGYEAFQAQLLRRCRDNPKMVGNQPLGCAGLAALLRKFVVAMNDGRLVGMAAAWDAVQHNACGKLSDTLRKNVCLRLRSLASGEGLPEGGKLPMTDEDLHRLLDQERQHVRAVWDERAIGDASVKNDYWKDLEASLAREETGVRMQNARRGDREFKEVLDLWQHWLADENGTWESGAKVCESLAKTMDYTPGAPVVRAAIRAVESAGQRLGQLRSELARSSARGSSTDRPTADSVETSELKAAERRAVNELAAKTAELETMQVALLQAQADVENMRGVERATRELQRETTDREVTLRMELEHSRADSITALSERSFVAAQEHEKRERLSRSKSETESKVTSLAAQLDDANRERAALRAIVEDSSRSGQDALEETHMKLQEQNTELVTLRSALSEAERALATKQQQIVQERRRLFADQAERESAFRADINQLLLAITRADDERLAAQRVTRLAQWDADAVVSESRRLKDDLEHAQDRMESLIRQLAHERQHVHVAHAEVVASHSRVIEEHTHRVEEQQKTNQELLLGTRNQLLDRERTTGLLEGKIQALTYEADHLREQLDETRRKLRAVETDNTQHAEEKENLKWSMRGVSADLERATAKISEAEALRQVESDRAKQLECDVANVRRSKCQCAMQ